MMTKKGHEREEMTKVHTSTSFYSHFQPDYAYEWTRDLHRNFPAVLPLFLAGNPAVKGTECEGYPREGK